MGDKENPAPLRIVEAELQDILSKGRAAMIRKVNGVDLLVCSRRGGRMKVVTFLTDHAAVSRIIRHLKLPFTAEKSPPAYVFEQVALMAAKESREYDLSVIRRGEGLSLVWLYYPPSGLRIGPARSRPSHFRVLDSSI